MPRRSPRRWGLRANLLAPVVALAIVAMGGLAALDELSARAQVDGLLTRRAETVLAGVTDRLAERERAKRVFAQLLADDPAVGSATARGDVPAITRMLVPQKARLGLARVEVRDVQGRPLVSLGGTGGPTEGDLARGALAGLTGSAVYQTERGVEVVAAAPIKNERGIVGVLVVGNTLTPIALGEVRDRDGVELLVLHEGRIVATTIADSGVLDALRGPIERGAADASSRYEVDGFRIAVRPLGDGGHLAALIPTADVIAASRQRGMAALLGGAGLVAGLLAVGLLLARRIGDPLATMAAVTRDIEQGSYDRRVAPSSIRELDELGGAVNHLAVQIEQQIADRTRAAEELRKYTGQLERSNRELQNFAYVASHDLQEPLRKIQAFGDRLVVKYRDELGTEGQDYLARMQAAAARMQAMINDLLALSRVTTQDQPPVPVSLDQVAAEVVADLEARLEQTGGRVELGELATIEGNRLQMRQLLQNLIGNALKFRRDDEPPVVRVEAQRSSPSHIRLTVSDNGIGFDEKYLEKIFAPFQRLHGRAAYEGTGIGLAICRKVVERHGGTITASSNPGKGTTFIVELPLAQPETSHGAAAA